MRKIVDVEIELTPDDVVEYLKQADNVQQSYILRKIARVNYQYPSKVGMQLASINEDIQESYDHDTRNVIKSFIQTLNEYLGGKQ